MPELARNPVSIPTREPRHGFVSRAPIGAGQPFQVVIPDFDGGDPSQDGEMLAHEIRRWIPRGATLPKVGDEVLVLVDDQAEPWVAAWWPTAGDASLIRRGKTLVQWSVKGLASALTTVNHGFGTTPGAVVANAGVAASSYAEIAEGSVNATSFQVRLVSTAGEVAAETLRAVYWIAA